MLDNVLLKHFLKQICTAQWGCLVSYDPEQPMELTLDFLDLIRMLLPVRVHALSHAVSRTV